MASLPGPPGGSYLSKEPSDWELDPKHLPNPPKQYSNCLKYLKACVANMMLWVEHYNARVEYFKARLRCNGDPFGFGLVPLEIETLAEYLAKDIQKVCHSAALKCR